MALSPLEELEDAYPEVIAQMDKRFDAHDFILKLACGHQRLYVQALADCVADDRPFKILHGLIAKRLINYPSLVRRTGVQISKDIFQQDGSATTWVKLNES